MSAVAPAGSSKSIAVMAIGLLTLLLGGAYGVLGGQFIFVGTSWFGRPEKDPWGQLGALFGLVPAFLVVLGIALLMLSILGLVAGWGVLLRKTWGRILAFILAGLAILLGLVWVAGGDPDATDIALGAPQILYGILAVITLALTGGEFSRSRV